MIQEIPQGQQTTDPNTQQPPVPKKTGEPVSTPENDLAKQRHLKSFWDSYNQGVSDFGHEAGALTSQSAKDEFFYNRPNPYNPESLSNINQNFERYYSHPSYDELGFNPWRDNEALYNQQGSAWGDVGRAMMSGAKLIPTGFMANLRSWGDVLSGDLMAQDEESAQEMKRLTTIGMSTRGGFTGFASNLMNSAGYTVGVGLELAAEGLVAAALLPESGAASGALWAERAAMSTKNIGKIFNVVEGFNEALATLKNFENSKTVWNALKNGAQVVNPFGYTTETLNILKTSENLTGMAKFSKTAAAFHKDIALANATISESKLEGALVTDEMKQRLTDEFFRERGRLPQTKEEIDSIEKLAREAGDKTLLWNLPGIWLTNKITLEPLLNRFGKLGEEAATRVGTRLVDTGTKLETVTAGTAMKGLLKPKTYGKAALTYFKGNIGEGVQESLQEVIGGAAKDYYTAVFNNRMKQGLDQITGENYSTVDLENILGKNVADQFGGQGFETFASGFFMGGLLGPQGPLLQVAKEGYSRAFDKARYDEYKKKKQEYNDRTVQTLNEIYQDPLKYFGSGIINLGSAGNTLENQEKSVLKKSQKDFYDVTDQSVWSQLTSVFETRTQDIFLNKLRSIQSMTPQAIEQAYPGTVGTEVKQKIDDIIDRAKFLKNSYDTWNQIAPNPFRPNAFKKDTPEYQNEALHYAAWQKAKEQAIFYNYSIERNLERIGKIQNDIVSTKSFNNIAANDITILTDVPSLNKEIGLLKQDITALKGTTGVGVKTDLAQKQKKFNLLTDFRQNLQNYFITQHMADLPKEDREALSEKMKNFEKTTDKELKASFQKYMKFLAAQNNVLYMSDIDLNNAYEGVKDTHVLKPEVKNMSDIVNMLSNPTGFREHYDRIDKLFGELWANKEQDIQNGVSKSYSRIEGNQLLNNLYRLGYVVDPAEASQIINKGEIPTSFYNVVTKEKVYKGDSSDYLHFEALVNDFLSATKEPAPTETPAKEETVTKGAEPAPAEEKPPVKKVVVPYNVQEKIDAIKTGKDLIRYENEIMSILGNYDKTVDEGISKEIEQEVFNRIQEKERAIIESFNPQDLSEGNVVQMFDKNYDKMMVKKITDKEIRFVKIGEGPNLTVRIKKDNLSKAVKFKYTDTMAELQVELSAQEKQKAQQNQQNSEELMQDVNALKTLQEEAAKDGADKVTNDFLKNLGCK